MSAVLELTDVSRIHGEGETEVHALRSVSFAAYAGELVTVMGPSGSGKSTLLTLASPRSATPAARSCGVPRSATSSRTST